MLILCFSALALSVPVRAADEPPVSAESMILIHADSGRELFSQDPDRPMRIASTTKLMTALTAVKTMDPDMEVEIREPWTRVEGSRAGLRAGERWTGRQLLEGLLLSSGNDAAIAVAETVDGSIRRFADRMNREAEALGMRSSHFVNPHGLDADGHVSTARDLAILMTAVMKEPLLREILAEPAWTFGGVTRENHNRLLWSCPGVDGGKTGFTRAAGRCLVSTCCRDGLRLICVTLSDPNDWEDHAMLYDLAFARYELWSFWENRKIPSVPVLFATPDPPGPVGSDEGLFCVEKNRPVTVEWRLPPLLICPGRIREEGTAIVFSGGEELGTVSFYWPEAETWRSVLPGA